MIKKIILKSFYLLERLRLKIFLKANSSFWVRLQGAKYNCQNKWSYLSAIKEIYIDECYLISSNIQVDSILDLGANLGFSVGYFKKKYPNCKVLAFEADPEIFKYLERNIKINQFEDVDIVNGAAWIENAEMSFYQDYSQGGSLQKRSNHLNERVVQTYDLKEVIKQNSFDLLKLDVEGAESEIVKHIADVIGGFKLVFIEYHESSMKIGCLSEILKVLEDNHFKYSFSKIYGSDNIFSDYNSNEVFDLQLNIHAIRIDQIENMRG